MKKKKVILIICCVLYIVVLFVVIYFQNNKTLETKDASEQVQGGEVFTWEFDFYELTEEQQKLFKELEEQGVSFSERIKIVLPEEYEKLEENKLVKGMMDAEKKGTNSMLKD